MGKALEGSITESQPSQNSAILNFTAVFWECLFPDINIVYAQMVRYLLFSASKSIGLLVGTVALALVTVKKYGFVCLLVL